MLRLSRFFSRMDHEFATRWRSPTLDHAGLWRSLSGTATASTLYAGELEIHPAEGLALATGQALTLSVREFELLVAMAQAARDDRHARGALPRRLGRRAARRRPLGRCVRLQAAHQARSRDARPPLHPHPPRLRLPLPTPAFTKCGKHSDLSRPSRLHDSPGRWTRTVGSAPARAGMRLAARMPRPTPIHRHHKPEGDAVVIKLQKTGATVLGVAALSLARRRLRQQLQHRRAPAPPAASSVRHDLRRRLHLRGARLRTVGLLELRPRAHRQLPGRRLGRRHHRAGRQDRRLRRLRPAAEGRRRSGARQGRRTGADPDVPGRDHRLLQPPRRQSRPEARRHHDRRHLPRQDQDLERRRDQGAEPRRHAAEHRDHRDPPLGLLGHLRRLHRLPRRRGPRMGEQGRLRQQGTSPGRPAPAPRATPASPARSSRPPARSATSSRPTRCSTTSPTPA